LSILASFSRSTPLSNGDTIEIIKNEQIALVNNDDMPVSMDYVLNAGDQIVVQKGPSITAELLWFKYLKTEGAINILISYFRSLGTK